MMTAISTASSLAHPSSSPARIASTSRRAWWRNKHTQRSPESYSSSQPVAEQVREPHPSSSLARIASTSRRACCPRKAAWMTIAASSAPGGISMFEADTMLPACSLGIDHVAIGSDWKKTAHVFPGLHTRTSSLSVTPPALVSVDLLPASNFAALSASGGGFNQLPTHSWRTLPTPYNL